MPDIASVPVADTLAALHVNAEAGFTHAEINVRRKENDFNEMAEKDARPSRDTMARRHTSSV